MQKCLYLLLYHMICIIGNFQNISTNSRNATTVEAWKPLQKWKFKCQIVSNTQAARPFPHSSLSVSWPFYWVLLLERYSFVDCSKWNILGTLSERSRIPQMKSPLFTTVNFCSFFLQFPRKNNFSRRMCDYFSSEYAFSLHFRFYPFNPNFSPKTL